MQESKFLISNLPKDLVQDLSQELYQLKLGLESEPVWRIP